MAILATDVQRVSNLVKYEFEPSTGFCTELVSVTIPAGGYKIGTVLDNAGALILLANTANAKYVIIDDQVQNMAAGSAKVLCLVRGPAILADNLIYGSDITTGAQKLAVKAVLEGRNIIVSTQA